MAEESARASDAGAHGGERAGAEPAGGDDSAVVARKRGAAGQLNDVRSRILRRLAPALIAAFATAVPFIVMCTERRYRWSVPLGATMLLLSAVCILDAI